MQISFSAQQIATVLKGSVEGNPNVEVNNFSKIEDGKQGTLTFLANPKYTHFIYDTNASIVLVNDDFVAENPIKATLIRVPNAYAALATLLNIIEQSKPKKTGVEAMSHVAPSACLGQDVYIGSFAYIGDNVKVGDNTQIFPQSYVGDNVTIGTGTIIYPGVKIYAGVTIGNNCIIHAGAVVGSDGFGFAFEGGVYNKIPQMGSVIIGDDVEIGANTTIDRAVMGATQIGNGTKLDNLIQIAHNVEVGEHTAMAAQVGISGSSKIGDNCILGGQVGIGGHITIGKGSSIGAQSGIISNIKEDSKIIGSPAMPVKDFFKSSIIIRKLPEIYKQVNEIKKEIDNIKNS